MKAIKSVKPGIVNAPQILMQMMTGFWVSQAIYSVAKVGVADQLKEGPQSVAVLAHRLNAHEENLYRVMRALASLGIFRETEDRVFELTPAAALLGSDSPNSMRPIALMLGEENYHAWGNLYRAIQSGESPFEETYGMNAYAYFEQHPDAAGNFNSAMTALVSNDNAAILESFDFSQFNTIVDVGGGHGMLLSALLKRYSTLRGVLFDLPHVVANAGALLRNHGIEERCRVESGDFYEAVPAGGDAYILSRVLHAFSDDHCDQILQSIHAAMPRTGKLLVMESLLQPGNDPATAKTKLMDVNMLVFAPGGRDRTLEEYNHLFGQSGFQLNRVVRTESGIAVLEAIKRTN
ncbi:MAG TPA: methyltransferase [Coleofasciculaceae cyanobacterium]|jgi:cyclopropane fatty-acyl-phospholipid synthase-like methyltransferase